MDYIYHGELQIYQHDLDRFLGIAERLKLEGLIGAQQIKDENGDITDNILDDYINDYDFPKSKKENQMTKDVIKTETRLGVDKVKPKGWFKFFLTDKW